MRVAFFAACLAVVLLGMCRADDGPAENYATVEGEGYRVAPVDDAGPDAE